MELWDSPVTHSLALFGIIGFAVLVIVGLIARIVWTRSFRRNQASTLSESVLGAVGGPSTYRAVRSDSAQRNLKF
jgi:hypothetical protein